MGGIDTRRWFLHSAGIGLTTAVAGCFGISNAFPPDHGTIHIYDHDWPGRQTLRLVIAQGNTTVQEHVYEIPTADPALDVPPATYHITVYINGDEVATWTWDVTNCTSHLYVMLYEEPGTVRITTSAC